MHGMGESDDVMVYRHMSALDVSVFRKRPDLDDKYRALRERVIKQLGYDPCGSRESLSSILGFNR